MRGYMSKIKKTSNPIMGYVYKTIYPNGKIYVGSDHCRTLDKSNKNYLMLIDRYENVTYFGSSTNSILELDILSWDRVKPIREILVPLQIWESVKLLLDEENRFIRELNANDPEIGYNLQQRKCCIAECKIAIGKFYRNEDNTWICAKHYSQKYHQHF
jgi:hypothetical protein